MNPAALEQYLHAHIPLSKAMAVEVLSASVDGVALRAPLAPNINHRDTVFGGSASAVAILAAWSLVYMRLQSEAAQGRIIIREHSMRYTRPIAGAFEASALAPDPEAWRRLLAAGARGRMGRIAVRAALTYREQMAGAFEGTFVVLPAAGTVPDGGRRHTPPGS